MANIMTKARLLITKKNVFLDAESKTKSTFFKIDSTFRKNFIQYIMENNIRLVNTKRK